MIQPHQHGIPSPHEGQCAPSAVESILTPKSPAVAPAAFSGVDRYCFTVKDLHHLLLAGLPAHYVKFRILSARR